MNDLAGWGFTTPDAFVRHFDLPAEQVRHVLRKRGGRHLAREELAAYAATLEAEPSVMDVRRHFRCSRAASYRYLTTISEMIAARTQVAA